MKTTSYTKGPWTVDEELDRDEEGSYPVTVINSQRQCIHAIGQPWIKERLAVVESNNAEDAKLIAAAPSLLESLEDILEDYISELQSEKATRDDPNPENWIESVVKARAAIALATKD